MPDVTVFVPLAKVDVARREVWGWAAEESPDKSNEIMDYAASKPFFEAWSASFAKATDGKSLGNVRSMHGNIAAGKLVHFEPQDAAKKIYVGAHIVDDGEWAKVEKGVYTGFSIGGKYAKRWADPDKPELKRYAADPSEISLVDNPCMYGATFEVVKADGAQELGKFVGGEVAPAEPESIAKAGARHSSTDARMIQDMHDQAVALGATCSAADAGAADAGAAGADAPESEDKPAAKLAKSFDDEPAWIATVAAWDISDSASAVGMLTALAGRMAESAPDVAAKFSAAAQLITEALAAQVATQAAAVAAAGVDATQDEALAAPLEMAAKLDGLTKAVDPLTKAITGIPAEVSALLGPDLSKRFDVLAAELGALKKQVEGYASVASSVGPMVRAMPASQQPAPPPDPLAAIIAKAESAGDMQLVEKLRLMGATEAIKGIHAAGPFRPAGQF